MVNWFMTEKPRICNGERVVSSINGDGKTGLSHEKEWSWSSIVHRVQKPTQNGLKIWM